MLAREVTMFSKQYIKNCIKTQSEIQRFRTFKFPEANKEPMLQPRFSFEEGDYFYHPEMEEGEGKKVIKKKEVFLYASDLKRSYPESECFWIPNVKQLRKGLETVHVFLGDMESKGEEQLLNEYMAILIRGRIKKKETG